MLESGNSSFSLIAGKQCLWKRANQHSEHSLIMWILIAIRESSSPRDQAQVSRFKRSLSRNQVLAALQHLLQRMPSQESCVARSQPRTARDTTSAPRFPARSTRGEAQRSSSRFDAQNARLSTISAALSTTISKSYNRRETWRVNVKPEPWLMAKTPRKLFQLNLSLLTKYKKWQNSKECRTRLTQSSS